MSREKQIEEIAKALCEGGFCRTEEWLGCGLEEGKYCARCTTCAEDIYNVGIRKQSEGEWIRQDKGKGRVAPEAVCSNCGRDVEYQVIDGKWAFENYCSHCGAKMKGGAE